MKVKLPGEDEINRGLANLNSGEDLTVEGLLVAIGRPRLLALGHRRIPSIGEPEHKLYALLEKEHGDSTHSVYNSWIRKLVSYERACACTNTQTRDESVH